jgi:N-methylhydantoinase B
VIDPVLVEIVQGTLASIEAEVEEAIGRTARSPMIRDQHDFRAGIHDRRLRKLTGRSYSALVHPVVRDFPLETMRAGDVFFHNDVYLSEGGIGHLPDLCVTVPVLDDGDVVAFVQAFGHHDDIGGSVPGSMPSDATSAYHEGLMVPPVKLFDAGVPNDAVMRIIARNSRMPESLAGDIDAECAATLMGAARVEELFSRYGREAVEACFDAILANTTETFRREVLAKIPDGTYGWEDYAEHDGVDPPQLHRQRITLTKRDEKLVIDFTGTGPQAKGPINHAGDYADGNFLKKWLAPILRNLADTPERMAELDVNEGVVELIDMRFPEPGTLLTPVFPAPTNARTFVILRMLGVFAGALAQAVGAGCRPIRRRSGTRASPGGTPTASGTSTARSSAAARAAAITPTGPTRSTSSRTPRTCRRSSSSRATRCASSTSVCGSTRAAPASSGAASGTARTSASSRTRASCRSPTARSLPAGESTAAGPGCRSR